MVLVDYINLVIGYLCSLGPKNGHQWLESGNNNLLACTNFLCVTVPSIHVINNHDYLVYKVNDCKYIIGKGWLHPN